MTWSQLSRRTLNAARELSHHASVGDRVVILAPQGLDYVLAFLGSMQAGLIAVPLPLPHRGASHDRVSAVFDDTSPSVVLTTSTVADDVAEYLDRAGLDIVPKIVEVDAMNVDGPVRAEGPGPSATEFPSTAYLQYSSGSTRLPTGVMISHQNLQVNYEQLMRKIFRRKRHVWSRSHHGVLAALLSRHGSGPRRLRAHPRWLSRRDHEPDRVPAAPRAVDAALARTRAFSAAPELRLRPGRPQTTDEDLAGLDLGDVLAIISGAERVAPAISAALHGSVREVQLPRPDACALLRARRGNVVRRRPANRANRRRSSHFDTEKLTAGTRRAVTAEPGRR